MLTPLTNQIKVQVKLLTGFVFEDFIKELFLLAHGERGFLPTRPVRDKGCDGILVSERTILACYGATEYDKKDFEKKVDDDYGQYKLHWQANYPNWMMVVNHPISPDQIKKIDALDCEKKELFGIDQLISLIENRLNGFQRRKIAKFLKIDKEFLSKDYLNEILNDLLKEEEEADRQITYKKLLNTVDKIKLNYKDDEVEAAMNEHELIAVESLNDIQTLISGYSDDDIRKIKLRIVTDFNTQTGSFKEKLDGLTKKYLEKYADESDDEYRYYIRAVLIYLFEQCLIGIKTPQENASTTS